ncbi:MAG TPA: hypothetical protein VFP84_35940, partial [Kofleriaceae bacterium]|nr:hypothetical protein [Kofleriaceae bacterium]
MNPGQTDIAAITTGPIELIEETSTLNAPDAEQLLEHMLELIARESAALAETGAAGEKLADLYTRIALATWDVRQRPDEALRLLARADGHPLAPRLRTMAALDDVEQLAALPEASGALAIEVAEAWLWRHGDPARAAEIVDRLLAGDLPSAWRAHVMELGIVAHGARGQWPRVVELCTGGVNDRSPPEDIAATGALLIDRGHDARAALELCWRKLQSAPSEASAGTSAAGWLRCLDIALEAAIQLADPRRISLLERRAAWLDRVPGAAVEALATRLTVAAELDARRAAGDALVLWSELADDAAAHTPGALRRFARLRVTWSASAAATPDARKAKLAAHRRLADIECAEVAATHAWRALELGAALGDPTIGDT